MLPVILCYGLEQNMGFLRMCVFGVHGKERRNKRKNEKFLSLREVLVKFTSVCLFCFFFSPACSFVYSDIFWG